MKTYNFDAPVDRSGSGDLKHGVLKERFGREDLLALWVADMCWETPDFITEALRSRLEHSLYGYTVVPEDYWQSIIDWKRDHFGFEVQKSWLRYIPGVVGGIAFALNTFTQKGDKVIIQPPVYYPFRMTIENHGRIVVNNPLRRCEDGTYEMDFEQLESVAEGCKMLVLCNPHNPGGVVWSRETLTRLADFCAARGILVVSDEIHADLALFGYEHTPFAMVSEAAFNNCVILGAPSKTFNMAGIVSAWTIVPNDTLRRKFFHYLDTNCLSHPPLFAPIATIAAYQQGESWRKQMLAYVEENIRFVEDFCAQHIPEIRPLRPQASFLVWMDCAGLGLSQTDLVSLFVNDARLALNDGASFGPGGEGYMRLNVGVCRAVIAQALEQLKAAINARKA